MLENLKRWAHELKAQTLTLWFSRTHPDTPLLAKFLALLVVAYAFSPIDLIPDFIPILGYLDDLILVPAGIYLTLCLLPDNVIADSRKLADAWLLQNARAPRDYFVAACVVLVWAAAAYWGWLWLARVIGQA